MGFWDTLKLVQGRAFRQLGKKVLTPLANKVISVGGKAVDTVEHVVDAGTKVVDAVGQGAVGLGNVAAGLGSLLSNPIMIVAGGALALLVVSKLK